MILTHGGNSISRVGPHQKEVEIGGKWYPYVKIGNKLWIKNNLDYAWLGLPIGTSSSQYLPRASYYNNDEQTYGWNGNKCGLLYNGYAVNELISNSSTLLPSGWRVPNENDISDLISEIGGSQYASKLKAANLSWAPNWNGTDDYGLSIVPSGAGPGNNFTAITTHCFLWKRDITQVSNRVLIFTSSDSIISNISDLYWEYSIRIVKDAT